MFDLRLPIGYFFSIIALILVGYGLIAPAQTPLCSLKINLNLCWGLSMGFFGLCLIWLGHADRSAHKDEAQ